MIKFTLYTNCLIDVDKSRPSAEFVKKLLEAFKRSEIDLAIVASSASERQIEGGFLESIDTFKKRMRRLGFGNLELLPPLLRWDIGFWDVGLWADNETYAREAQIYKTMFPNSEHEWADCASRAMTDPSSESSAHFFRWRNQILDAQAYWAHEFHRRDVFVTSDKKFQRFEGHPEFPDAVIREAKGAVEIVRKSGSE